MASILKNLSIIALTGFTVAAAHAADPEPVRNGPLQQISASNFIKAESIPWQMVCEWKDAQDKVRAVWTVGRERPGADVVPASVLCVTVKRFIFSNGRGFAESHLEKDRSTALLQGRTTNVMYVLAGHGRSMVDGQTMETKPGDAFAQIADKPHQIAAIGAGYVQIGIGLPNVGPDGTLELSDADRMRGFMIHHKDAPKSEVVIVCADCKTPPPHCAGMTASSLLTLPNGAMTEVSAKKGCKTPARTDAPDTLIYIVKGKEKATIGGQTEELKTGDALFHPGGVPYSDDCLEATTRVEIKLPKVNKTP